MLLLEQLIIILEDHKDSEFKPDLKLSEKETKAVASKIAQMLFKQKAGPVTDKKRSKDPIFWGVSHQESLLVTDRNEKIKLTFDNSTDSGEYEINSLTPLDIEQGSQMDKAVKRIYVDRRVHSSKKTNYTLKGGVMVLREVHIGKYLNDKAVDFVKDLMALLNTNTLKVSPKGKK